MDKERQRMKSEHRDGDQNTQESKLNGTSSTISAKRKKHREVKRCAYLQDWLEKSCMFQQPEDCDIETASAEASEKMPVIGQSKSHAWWPRSSGAIGGQRLFNALSEPSGLQKHIPSYGFASYQPSSSSNSAPYSDVPMTHSYPCNPYSYSLESVSLPFYPMYPNPTMIVQNPYKSFRPVSGNIPSNKGKHWRSHKVYPFVFPSSCETSQVPSSSRNVINSIQHSALHNSKEPHHKVPPSNGISEKYVQTNAAGSSNSQDYTSLPPNFMPTQPIPKPVQRRFSDPGLVSAHAPLDWSKCYPNKTSVHNMPYVRKESTKPLPENGFDMSDLSEREGEDSSSESSSTTLHLEEQNRLVMGLIEEMNNLKEMNRKLFRELHETRAELESLRLQTSGWKHLGPDYEPGMLTDLIREVREAARIREEALLARVRLMVGAPDEGRGSPRGVQNAQRWGSTSRHQQTYTPEPLTENHGDAASTDRSARGSRDLEDLKSQLQQALAEKSRTNERLGKVEAQLQNLRLQQSPQESCAGSMENSSTGQEEDRPLSDQVLELEKEKLQLRQELQDAVTSRKESEMHASKLERLVGILRKKINTMNGLSLDCDVSEHQETTVISQNKEVANREPETNAASLEPSSLENTSESLASVCSSSTSTNTRSPSSPQVTMLGPVTDL